MEFIVGLFRFILFVDCALLILLVLIQLPKKEAGLGVAFGGAATDALFGAGAGNAITKLTKWCAVFFFVLSLGIAAADSHYARVRREAITRQMLAVESGAPAAGADSAKATTLNAPVAVPEAASNEAIPSQNTPSTEKSTDAEAPAEPVKIE
ncbi:MAG TPA: preprotein translocase subunit SecG [Verrucomicrobiota bacterium]|jgi:preprotein translocase subunit SecG|nr:preprotein translocase subunit SecG [Verrucomicrobiota bacterium]